MSALWLDRVLHETRHYYSICTSEEIFREKLLGLEIPESEWPRWLNMDADATTHFRKWEGKRICLVCVNPKVEKDPIQIVALIVHEAMHLWQKELELIGEQYSGSEHEAYAVQSIVQELLLEYRRQVYGVPR